jgi:hypothetical protein
MIFCTVTSSRQLLVVALADKGVDKKKAAAVIGEKIDRANGERELIVLFRGLERDGAFGKRSYVPGIPSHSLRGLVLSHRKHGAGERAVGLSQLIQDREVIGVDDRYQVACGVSLRPVGMVIPAARDHGRQLAGAIGDSGFEAILAGIAVSEHNILLWVHPIPVGRVALTALKSGRFAVGSRDGRTMPATS